MGRISAACLTILVGATIGLAGPGFAQEEVDLEGRGSIGASGGLMLFTGDEDMSDKAQPRLLGHFNMKYVISPNLAVAGTFGRGWNSYSGRGDTLAVIEPVTFGIEYRHNFEQWPRYQPHGGVGVGMYSVYIRDYLTTTRDPVTLESRHTLNWGMNVGVGLEYFMTRTVTVNYDFVWHYIFSENKEDFVAEYGENDSYVQFVVGVNYYFSLGILSGGSE